MKYAGCSQVQAKITRGCLLQNDFWVGLLNLLKDAIERLIMPPVITFNQPALSQCLPAAWPRGKENNPVLVMAVDIKVIEVNDLAYFRFQICRGVWYRKIQV